MDSTHEFIIGAIIQTVVFILSAYGMILKNDYSNKILKEELVDVKDELKKLADVVITQAVQTTRLDSLNTQFALLQRTVEDLRRGTGWIKGARQQVDGEYKGK